MPSNTPLASEDLAKRLAVASASHPHPACATKLFNYGTAGFRTSADVLEGVMFRVGVVAALRSMSHRGRTVGIMVTASHNPHQDNGVKVVEPMGEMLDEKWECHAVSLANASSHDELAKVALKIIASENIVITSPAKIVIARDTRPSGEKLVAAAIDGIRAAGGNCTDYGVLTTPQLHFITRCFNDSTYGSPNEAGYLEKLCSSFKKIISNKKLPRVVLDCANGVGALKMQAVANELKPIVDIQLVNTDTVSPSKLNHQCGADFVKTYNKQPTDMKLDSGVLYASFDGDGDRVVFYSAKNNGSDFFLLDGDRIAVLLTMALTKILRSNSKDETCNSNETKIGIVQTAYANGASMAYIRDTLKVESKLACTGVKHLHHAATNYDIGVYFEANGHGTVIIGNSPEAKKATGVLGPWRDLINETVGDATSDLLLVIAALNELNMDAEKWLAIYSDLPSRLVRVVVSDRNSFKTAEADTTLTAPQGLQQLVDAECKKHQKGRCFVRPSGTEDVVRVYAEAASTEACSELAYKVAGIIFDKAGGVGARPKEFL